MRKAIAVILTMALLLSLSVSAMAEDEIATVSWEDAVATAETILPGISELGEFFSIEGTGLKIWIPMGLQQRDTIGDLMLYLFADEDVSHAVTVIAEGLELVPDFTSRLKWSTCQVEYQNETR